MVLHLTKKLADKLKLSPAVETAEDELFSWRANYVQENGFRFVVFMNDASRFTLVVNEAKANKLKKLPELFVQTLRETFLALSVNPEVIDRYIAELGDISYAKNTDRKKTAQLNKSTDEVWRALHCSADDIELSLFASARLCDISSTGNFFVPTERMLNLLGKYGLPVLKTRALDLCVRLDLEGRDAVRRLRVPANITFERLHKLLQAAFEWRNYHLYNFGLFKEWKKNAYAQPDVSLVASEDDLEISPGAKLMAGVKLSDYVPEYRKILYMYDYGDDWHHYIEVESVIDDCEEKLPVLLFGEGDAPPEDVGGPAGVAEFLEVIADPKHKAYEHVADWAKSQWWSPFHFEAVAYRVKSCR